MARNCHKAVYHAISMQGLAAEFLYPAITRGDLQGQITAAQVEEALTKAIEQARAASIDLPELVEMLTLLYEE